MTTFFDELVYKSWIEARTDTFTQIIKLISEEKMDGKIP
jgi:hypothetical protein